MAQAAQAAVDTINNLDNDFITQTDTVGDRVRHASPTTGTGTQSAGTGPLPARERHQTAGLVNHSQSPWPGLQPTPLPRATHHRPAQGNLGLTPFQRAPAPATWANTPSLNDLDQDAGLTRRVAEVLQQVANPFTTDIGKHSSSPNSD